MAFLKVVEGNCSNPILDLSDERIVLGRQPSCHIVLDSDAVSRRHAVILQTHGTYFLEDLRSRNRTFLNDQPVEGRTELDDGSLIRICDVTFQFLASPAPPSDTAIPGLGPDFDTDSDEPTPTRTERPTGLSPVVRSPDPQEDEPEDGTDSSSIISTLAADPSSDSLRLSVNPEVKLRAILEILDAIGRELDGDRVLANILNGLFRIFPQADEGFALLKNESGELDVRAVKYRLECNDSFRYSRTIVDQAMQTGEAILSSDVDADERFESDSLTDMDVRSMMCVPLMSKPVEGEPEALGVIQLDTRTLTQQFTEDDLELLVCVGAQASMAFDNARLHQQSLQQAHHDRELELATQVQLGFLPTDRPRPPGYRFDDYYDAALRVGGDYFDYITLADGRIAIAVGDVAGKGVPAALLMARLCSAMRNCVRTSTTPSEAMTKLNVELASSGIGTRFITCVLAILDPHEHTLTMSNAGHLPPLLQSSTGGVRELGKAESGYPLGIAPQQGYRQTSIPLTAGDKVVFHTDGVTDVLDANHKIYGSKRLRKFIRGHRSDVSSLVSAIVADVDDFCSDMNQRDDVCIVGFEFDGVKDNASD